MSEIETLAASIDSLRAEMRELREQIKPAPTSELTLSQAMKVTNHTAPQSFYDWCKRRKVRPISRGRYSLRRLCAAMAA